MNTLYNLGGSLGYVGFLAWTLLIGALFFSLTLLKTPRRRLVAVVLIVGLFAAVPLRKASEVKQQVDRYRAYYDASAAMYQERCRAQAGYKIHKVVEDVEGIQLLKIRHRVKNDDPMAPGAAFALRRCHRRHRRPAVSGYRFAKSHWKKGHDSLQRQA